MQNQATISGLTIFQVKQEKDHQILISDSDHLLRRFGQLDLIHLNKDQKYEYRQRKIADEIIFVDQGNLKLEVLDLRSASPSTGVRLTVNIQESSMDAILIPFGVAYSLSTPNSARVIRLATHNEKDDQIQNISKSQLSEAIDKK